MATKSKTASAKMVKGATEAKAVKTSKAANDVIVDVASEVENLTQVKAFALVDELVQSSGLSEFKLGGVLAAIQDKAAQEGNEAWLDGCESFRALIESRFNMHYRKAMYLINIYKNLVEKQIPWNTVKDVGWTKLKELASILTPKNVDSWVAKAKKKTVIQLIEEIKKAEAKGKDAGESGPSTLTTMTFKLHEDQKEAVRSMLDKAKEETKTEFDNVALYNVAQAFLGETVTINAEGGEAEAEEPPKGKKALKEWLVAKVETAMRIEGVDYEIALKAFENVFPQIGLEVSVPE